MRMRNALFSRSLAARAAPAAALCMAAGSAMAEVTAEVVLPPIAVAQANASVFATPLAVSAQAVYTVNVEPGARPVPIHSFGLYTVIRKGVRSDNGSWAWQTYRLDVDTANDPYHTAASIGLDRSGFVHVAYDMHNLPWQYSVSSQPETIDTFVFRGQRVTAKARWGSQNRRVEFPAPGTASIPGTQVTYPAFFNDRDGRLYVTYRYAVRPARTWSERLFSGGLARYDEQTRRWSAIGGDVTVGRNDVQLPPGQTEYTSRPFISQPGWWVYQMRLAFDASNGMHVAWLWRRGDSGVDQNFASYAYLPPGSDTAYDATGERYELPIDLASASRVAPARIARLAPDGLYSPARISVSAGGHPVVALQSVHGPRYRTRLADKHWSDPVPVPEQAFEQHYDDSGHEWAFASGLRVLRRSVDTHGIPTGDWQTVYTGNASDGTALCHTRAMPAPSESGALFYVHANVLDDGRCRDDRVTIIRLSKG
ncbi:BNR-4 repeat-containing protein [Endozoicomonas sp. G2_2]|uniref:BNR-4 repeat-containing protein n=1 Tax=Endozoicomonas sp. G2_2 TaxID=2821092 RepID=UPI0032AEC92F